MKKRLYIISGILALILFQIPAQAQQGRPRDQRMQAIESRRIAYLTEKMALTPSEARVFWPIYNEYLRQVDALNESIRAFHRELPPAERISKEEATAYAEREVRRFEEAAALKRTAHEQLKEVLPSRKIALLYDAEKSFNRLLFRESQHRMRDRRNN